MKLSDNTLNILKNFSGINQSIEFKQGNSLRTISAGKTIFAEAVLDETFEKDFCIYDLTKLLAKLSLYKDADLSFDVDRINIQADRKRDYIHYCAPELLTKPPAKSISITEADCSFVLSHADLDWMRKSASISGLPNFVFESDGTVVNFIATDVKNNAADHSKIEIGTGDGKKFRVVMKAEHFKLLDGDYEVSVSKRGISKFKHKTINLSYFIAVDVADSSFEE